MFICELENRLVLQLSLKYVNVYAGTIIMIANTHADILKYIRSIHEYF